MSTLFAVIIKDNSLLDIKIDEDTDISDILDDDDVEIVEVAFRGYKNFYWKSPIAKFLPPKTKVYPVDNSPQGIYTIKDIHRGMKELNQE
jgi:hypothetical protein